MKLSDLVLLCAGNGVKGRARLQNLMYLLCLSLGRFEEGFLPGYFGPYSSRVAYEVDKLSALKLLREEVSPKGGGIVLHTYSLTSEGRALCDELIKEYPLEYEVIRNVMEKTGEIQDEELIKLTKTCFILRALLKEVENKASSYGWPLSKQDGKEAVEKLERKGVRFFLDVL